MQCNMEKLLWEAPDDDNSWRQATIKAVEKEWSACSLCKAPGLNLEIDTSETEYLPVYLCKVCALALFDKLNAIKEVEHAS